MRLVFDDLHSTGIFGWDYLRELGRNYAAYWQDYLDELAAKNLKREPPASTQIADRCFIFDNMISMLTGVLNIGKRC